MNALFSPDSLVEQPPHCGGETAGPAGFSVDSWAVGRLLARLHQSFIDDEELDDVLNAVLDPGTRLSMDDIDMLTPRLRKIIGQLAGIAVQRNAVESATELAFVVRRVRQLGDPVRSDLDAARGQLRLLALAALDVLELVSDDDMGVGAGPTARGGLRP